MVRLCGCMRLTYSGGVIKEKLCFFPRVNIPAMN